MGRKNQHEWGYVGFTFNPVQEDFHAPDVLFCGLCNKYMTHDSDDTFSKRNLLKKYPEFTFQEGWC